jgi:signal transduction histidine kinase
MIPPRKDNSFPVRWLWLGFLAVALSFLAATGLAELTARSIGRHSLLIARNAAPSIEALASARTIIHHLHVGLSKLLEEPAQSRAVVRSDVLRWLEEHASRLRSQIAVYLRAPAFPEEPPISRRIAREADHLDQLYRRIIAEEARGELAAAEALLDGPLAGCIERASAALVAGIDFNAERSRELALAIELTHSRSRILAMFLNAACVLLAAVVAILLWKLIQRHSALIESHRNLAEDKAGELDLFAGRVAHDLLNPLQAIAMSAELLALRTTDEESRALAKRCQLSLQRVKSLILGLLEFARSSAKPDPSARTEVKTVVEGLAAELARALEESKTELHMEPLPAVSVATSAGVLGSILSNLLHNAIKYIGDAPERVVRLRVEELATFVRFEVSDTGPGVPLELREKIFEPYFRVQRGAESGFGLGLATVKRLVEAHGGAIGVLSEPGRGSLFWFELPRAAETGLVPVEPRVDRTAG